ncbi:MAG TPA: KH domain-containing protein [candidate division Zixibacteria bacterium]|nr:KH domain-containing protein [candidate division Zixibacteria bacterium]
MSYDEVSRFYITIPRDRIGALIGPKGRVKKRLEESAEVDLEIDSESGDVIISAKPDIEDPFLAIKARDFVHAVGRGFNPTAAFSLLDEDIYLEIINMKVVVGDNPNKIQRFRGRIIGREGRTRKVIEETTGTKIVVYGNTVSIIGQFERLRVAREAIHLILDGSKHGTVYAFLEEKAQMFRMSSKELWDKASKDSKI